MIIVKNKNNSEAMQLESRILIIHFNQVLFVISFENFERISRLYFRWYGVPKFPSLELNRFFPNS